MPMISSPLPTMRLNTSLVWLKASCWAKTLTAFLTPEAQELVRRKTSERGAGQKKMPMSWRSSAATARGVRYGSLPHPATMLWAPSSVPRASFVTLPTPKRAEDEIRSLARFVSEKPGRRDARGRRWHPEVCQPQAFIQLPEWRLEIGQKAPEVVWQVVQLCLESGSRLALDLIHGEQLFSFLAVAVVECRLCQLVWTRCDQATACGKGAGRERGKVPTADR